MEQNSGTKLAVPAIPKGATPSELDQILKTQKKEEELLEEQHELLQKKLLHDYDGYIRDLGSSQEKKVDLEIVSGDVALKKDIRDSRKPVQHAHDSRITVQAASVGTYDLSAPEIIPSYSIICSNPGKTTSSSVMTGGIRFAFSKKLRIRGSHIKVGRIKHFS